MIHVDGLKYKLPFRMNRMNLSSYSRRVRADHNLPLQQLAISMTSVAPVCNHSVVIPLRLRSKQKASASFCFLQGRFGMRWDAILTDSDSSDSG